MKKIVLCLLTTSALFFANGLDDSPMKGCTETFLANNASIFTCPYGEYAVTYDLIPETKRRDTNTAYITLLSHSTIANVIQPKEITKVKK